MKYQYLLHYLIFVIGFPISVSLRSIELILSGEPIRRVIPKGRKSEIFCINDNSEGTLFSSTYEEINIYVKNVKDNFDWHVVKGKSTDDFYVNFKSFVQYIKSEEVSTDNDIVYDASELNENIDLDSSFLRDILSACPSPVFSRDLSMCKMPFSTRGKSCISVTSSTDKDLSITIQAKKEINKNHILSLLFGLIFLRSASSLSRNDLFQVSFSMILNFHLSLLFYYCSSLSVCHFSWLQLCY